MFLFDSTSNTDLEQLAIRYNIPLNQVTSKDQLQGIPKEGGYIFNLQDLGEGRGTHWVCFLIYQNHACYFDSFGQYPPSEFKVFVKKTKTKKKMQLYYVSSQIQHLDSNACGIFCLCFLHYMSNGAKTIPFTQHLNLFSAMFDYTDFASNEIVLKQYFQKLDRNKTKNKLK